MLNLSNFYFKKSAEDDTYNSEGEYASLLDYVGTSDAEDTTNLPLCNFFKEYNDANTSKIREYIATPTRITQFDSGFVTKPLWEGKTFRAGIDCKPARKYDMEILHDLCIPNGASQVAIQTNDFYPASGAGIIAFSGGGGGGGGGDSGGWLDEPAGGGGGGSGGWFVIYYRYKTSGTRNPDKCFSITFGSSGNFQAAGGAREKNGSTGCAAYLKYEGITLLTATGGSGGKSDNTSDTTQGGAGGTFQHSATHSTGSGLTLINDNNLFVYLLSEGGGAKGQNSGQGGASPSSTGGQVPAVTINIPSVINGATISLGGKGGGAGGKSSSSDPGGGGGAGSLFAKGGKGNTGDVRAEDGGYGSGGGGASERGSYSGKGGYAAAYIYKFI